jgi:BirA family transcriptional regulator, biotin operon repressor / biotin---[acetyl-CoA-carboxylase] ligase
VDFQLGDKAKLAGYRVSGLETVTSTNALAAEAAQGGDAGQHWFVALEQTEGRGRRGRTWFSQKGNLAASLLLVFDYTGDYAGLGFVAGVALAEALRALAPEVPVKLKWPNDLLFDGRKLAGILLEAQRLTSGRQSVVIGIGVNNVAAPGDLPYPATSLAEQGIAISAGELFPALSECFAESFDLWRGGDGLARVLENWRRHAAGIGGPIAVTTPTGPVAGVFEALDDSGRLLVRRKNGMLTTISAGDVYFGTIAGGGKD